MGTRYPGYLPHYNRYAILKSVKPHTGNAFIKLTTATV